MAKKRSVRSVEQLVSDINERLDSIEDLMMFTIRADQRFRVGQRVKFSAKAERQQISKGRPPRGTVKRVDSVSVVVLLDGRKQPTSFNHMFLEPV